MDFSICLAFAPRDWKSAHAIKALASGPTGRDSSAQPNGLGNVRIITGGLKGGDTPRHLSLKPRRRGIGEARSRPFRPRVFFFCVPSPMGWAEGWNAVGAR